MIGRGIALFDFEFKSSEMKKNIVLGTTVSDNSLIEISFK